LVKLGFNWVTIKAGARNPKSILFDSKKRRVIMSTSSFDNVLPARKQIDILVVENNPADTRLTEHAFIAAGMTSGFHSVSDGEDALNYVHKKGKHLNAPTPDLIFMDLSLPRVSGLEVLKAIKSTPHLMHIPIVIASGTEDPEHIRAVYALNGNCFMRKPNDLPQFLKFVESCFAFWGSVVTFCPPRPTDSRSPAFKESGLLECSNNSKTAQER
jgi:CheY-like chemotaxis protein